MNIISLFSKKSFALSFSLLCGLAYFGIVSAFVLNNTAAGGGLLLIFFFPAIICGAALFIYKTIQSYLRAEATKPLHILLWGHIVVFLFSIVTVLEAVIF